MTTKYSKNEDINAQGESFILYLKTFINDEVIWGIIDKVSTFSDVYIFSGVIRDFLTGDIGGVRDIDIVVSKRLPINFFSVGEIRKFRIYRNQFGGLKLKKGDLSIDIWYIEDTWGVRVLRMRATPYSLIRTAFFNFSAIVFDYRRKKFIYDNHFETFIKTRKLDIVFPQNPNIALCIINLVHYASTRLYSLSPKAQKWLLQHYKEGYDYETVQIKHFGKKIYNGSDIEKFVKQYSHG